MEIVPLAILKLPVKVAEVPAKEIEDVGLNEAVPPAPIKALFPVNLNPTVVFDQG
jgi:hypothetical protein